jgi:hypothetical protein
MFSLSDLARTQYVVFNIQDIPETFSLLPEISPISESRQNTDVSQIINKTENLLEALTADSLQETDQKEIVYPELTKCVMNT